MFHELKILPEFFDAVVMREKTFEIRKNDRGFKVGDWLALKEWDGENYTGREVVRYVNYILYDWQAGLKDGYCIMNLKISNARAVLDGMKRGEIIKQVILNKCKEREAFGYANLQSSDITDILEQLKEHGITLTKDEMDNLGFS